MAVLSATAPTPAKATPATDTVTLSSQTSMVPPGMQTATPPKLTHAEKKALHYQALLQGPSFAPKDVNRIIPPIYPEAIDYPPAPAPCKPVTDGQLKWDIVKTLMNRFKIQNKETPKGQPKVNPRAKAREGRAFFEDPALQGVDPRIRTSYALLSGTPLEGAMASFKEGVSNGTSSYRFGVLANPTSIAQTIVHEDGTREVVFNEIYQHEDPRQLAATAGHEELHRDPVFDQTDGEDQREELFAHSLQTATYAQFVQEAPKLAGQKTELAQNNNTFLMALLNSRDANGDMRILNTKGDLLFPGSAKLSTYFGKPWAEAAGGLGPDTPGNAVLDHAMAMLNAPPGGAPQLDPAGNQVDPAVNFDDSTLQQLDATIDKAFTDKQWLQIAKHGLKLQVPGWVPPLPVTKKPR